MIIQTGICHRRLLDRAIKIFFDDERKQKKKTKTRKSNGRLTRVTGEIILQRHGQFISADGVRGPKESHGLQRDPENRQRRHGARHQASGCTKSNDPP